VQDTNYMPSEVAARFERATHAMLQGISDLQIASGLGFSHSQLSVAGLRPPPTVDAWSVQARPHEPATTG